MSTPIALDIPHRLGTAAAHDRLDRGIGKIGQMIPGGGRVTHSWTGETMTFTVTALGCCALTLATQGPGMVLNGVLASRPMRLLGKVSFGFYVYHNLMLYLVRKLFERLGVANGPAAFALALVLTIAVAIVSYKVYEAPFLRLKRRFTIVGSRPV